MKAMDKLQLKIKVDKNLAVFLVVLLLIGISVGALFVSILNSSDKELVTNHLLNFFQNIENNKLDYYSALKNNLIANVLMVLIIWLLGISVIGLPVIVIIFFSKSFILGFSIGSILSTFKIKGIIYGLIYVFPGQILTLLGLLLLMMYSMSFSFKIIYTILKKQVLDFKFIMNKYFKILILVMIIVVVMGIYDTYLMPKLLKMILSFVK